MASSPGGVRASVDTRAHGGPPSWIPGAFVQHQQFVLHLSPDLSWDTVSNFCLIVYLSQTGINTGISQCGGVVLLFWGTQ